MIPNYPISNTLPSRCRVSNLAAHHNDDDVLVVTPRFLGLGSDRIIGGACGPRYRVIDLSLLSDPVVITWASRSSGSITDGADSLVFAGVEEIILPTCMQPGPSPVQSLSALA